VTFPRSPWTSWTPAWTQWLGSTHASRATELLHSVRTSAHQIGSLLDGRATLTQRRRLLTAAGWLALLASTLHVDLGQRRAAAPRATLPGH
jgi:hypothetical protein